MEGSKIVYIAHPISGDVEGNLAKIAEIYRDVSRARPDVVPFVPYFATCTALDDSEPLDRQLGIMHNVELFKRGMIDELWLFGPCISNGMKHEIEMAEELGILVVDKTTPLLP